MHPILPLLFACLLASCTPQFAAPMPGASPRASASHVPVALPAPVASQPPAAGPTAHPGLTGRYGLTFDPPLLSVPDPIPGSTASEVQVRLDLATGAAHDLTGSAGFCPSRACYSTPVTGSAGGASAAVTLRFGRSLFEKDPAATPTVLNGTLGAGGVHGEVVDSEGTTRAFLLTPFEPESPRPAASATAPVG